MQEDIVRDACCRLDRCASASRGDDGSRLAILSCDTEAELLANGKVGAVRVDVGIVCEESANGVASNLITELA